MNEEQDSLLRMTKEPRDIDAGTIEVTRNDRFEVVLNLPKMETDANGLSFMAFSPSQARRLANCLMKHAIEALQEWREGQKIREIPKPKRGRKA